MNRLALVSSAIAYGKFREALVAAPPSPAKDALPLPATVVIMPFALTLRMRLLSESAMNRFPLESTATPFGEYNAALVAAPPSPEKPMLALPATVTIVPFAFILRTRQFNQSVRNRLDRKSTRLNSSHLGISYAVF